MVREWWWRKARYAALAVFALCAMALTGCGPSLTYADVVATAQVSGCWPGNRPPPDPVTVTPLGGASPTPTATTPPGVTPVALPTITSLPTTTAMPRCTPGPEETLEPFPTPFPTDAPNPTQLARESGGGSPLQTVFRVSGAALGIDLALNPHTGSPAVAAIDVPMNSRDGSRVYARVFDLSKRRWGPTQTLDVGASRLKNTSFRSAALAVGGDGTVHAVWGVTPYPALEIFYSFTKDNGETWSPPELLGSGYFRLLDAAVADDGSLFVLTMPRRPTGAQYAAVLQRTPQGQWLPPEVIDGPSWYAGEGALQIVGSGPRARVIVLVTGEGPHVYLATRDVAGGVWSVGRRTIELPAGIERGELTAHVQGVAFGAEGVAFVFGTREAADLYAVVSRDAGATWSLAEPIVAYGHSRNPSRPQPPFPAIGYDARANRLISVWNCCKDALWGNAESTHYVSWSEPGSGVWQPDLLGEDREGAAVPLISGALSVGLTAGAQAPNSDDFWLAWVEDGANIVLRSFDLRTLLPAWDYPTPTIAPSSIGVAP